MKISSLVILGAIGAIALYESRKWTSVPGTFAGLSGQKMKRDLDKGYRKVFDKLFKTLAPELPPNLHALLVSYAVDCMNGKPPFKSEPTPSASSCTDGAVEAAYRNSQEFRDWWDANKDALASVMTKRRQAFIKKYFPLLLENHVMPGSLIPSGSGAFMQTSQVQTSPIVATQSFAPTECHDVESWGGKHCGPGNNCIRVCPDAVWMWPSVGGNPTRLS